MNPTRFRSRLEALVAGEHSVPAAGVLGFFDELPAVDLDEMRGEWDGAWLDTSHPYQACLAQLEWVGKRIWAIDDVEPLVCRRGDGGTFASHYWGGASLRRVEYRDVLTATIVYDTRPRFEHFRRVADGLLLGAMVDKSHEAPLLLYLRRL